MEPHAYHSIWRDDQRMTICSDICCVILEAEDLAQEEAGNAFNGLSKAHCTRTMNKTLKYSKKSFVVDSLHIHSQGGALASARMQPPSSAGLGYSISSRESGAGPGQSDGMPAISLTAFGWCGRSTLCSLQSFAQSTRCSCRSGWVRDRNFS